jgi:hypothetical protein
MASSKSFSARLLRVLDMTREDDDQLAGFLD